MLHVACLFKLIHFYAKRMKFAGMTIEVQFGGKKRLIFFFHFSNKYVYTMNYNRSLPHANHSKDIQLRNVQ